ncbi:MAG: CpaF family protein [Clostridia bacterium]|nr:CpaF family protein [Clostridia bacterium]
MENKHFVEIVDKFVSNRMNYDGQYADNELRKLIEDVTGELFGRIPSDGIDRELIVSEVYNKKKRLGLIQPLLDDPDVNEIMINGTDGIYIERAGDLAEYDKRYSDRDALFNNVQTMLSWANRTVNESSPIVDARLQRGYRINVVLPPVAINGPIVTIRKFRDEIFTMEDLISNGTLSHKQSAYMIDCVRMRKNIIISGATSSGKTTFLNVLAGFIQNTKRIITVEDTAELKLCQPNVVRLETRNSNTEGKGEIRMRQLIKAALRMRPDHLIIGEVRDESSLDMLTALCTGHEGSMSTVHANSAKDALLRLETLALWEGHVSSRAIRQMIVSGIHVIVQLTRDDKARRKVKEIVEVIGYEDDKIATSNVIV